MAFMGMLGTGDWSTNQRPYTWRQMMLYQEPNGDMPLTALLSMLPQERANDPRYYWWEKTLPAEAGAVTNVYTDVLSTAYTTAGSAGDTLYVKMAEAISDFFRAGHQCLLVNTANYADDTTAKVTSVVKNGANSYLVVKLLEDDPTTTGIADCNWVKVVGSISAEGSAMPDAIAYLPTESYNLTQIFKTPLSITRTARQTTLRTEAQYLASKNEAMKLHGTSIEKAFLHGARTSNTGSNGKPERTTGGLIKWVKAGGLTSDFSLDSDYDGDTWLGNGENWLDTQLETVFRYGGAQRLAFVGSGVILGINRLIKEHGQYSISERTTSYGIKVKRWETPFGDLDMKIHPLFSYDAAYRNSMLVINPADLKYRFIQDTKFIADPDGTNTGRNQIDGTDEQFLTECGLEYHFANRTAWLNGFNQDNPLS